MKILFLKGIKKGATGTVVGGANCLDVSVKGSVTTIQGVLVFKEARFHDAAITTIPKRTSAWVQIDANSDAAAGTPADVANTCTQMMVNWNGGGALQVGVGANAGAVSVIDQLGSGQTVSTGVALVAGDKLWVRAVQDADIVAGELTVKLLG